MLRSTTLSRAPGLAAARRLQPRSRGRDGASVRAAAVPGPHTTTVVSGLAREQQLAELEELAELQERVAEEAAEAAEEEEEDGEGDGGESERWMADYHPDASHQGSYSAPAPRAVGSQVATWNVVLWMMALLALVFALGRSSAPVWPGQPNSSTAFQQWRARRRGPRSSTDRTE
mmetsp:Transcript_2619/g.9594  ORF Transcript_2619/g.9594 Transcript_2619/m.9594 type:complete len:174 (-) Transcript_2619:75-596(-)